MDDFRMYSEEASKRLDKVAQDISDFKSLPPVQLRNARNDCKRLMDAADADIQNCELALNEIESPGQKQTARILIGQLREKLARNKADFEMNQQSDQKLLFGNRADQEPEIIVNYDQMNAQQVIKRADTNYQEAIERMQRGHTAIIKTMEVANEIQIEVQRQGELISRTDDKVTDIKSLLKVSNALLKNIYQRYLTDKCIICLIIVIVIVIIFLIIYGALGLDDENKLNTPDDEA